MDIEVDTGATSSALPATGKWGINQEKGMTAIESATQPLIDTPLLLRWKELRKGGETQPAAYPFKYAYIWIK